MPTKRQAALGWGNIAIGTRMGGSCDAHFFNCWSHMIAGGLRPGDTVLDAGIEMPQHFTATVLTEHFLASDADTLLMVDNDMIFRKDALERMRSDKTGWKYDVLSALSVTRRQPFYPIILRRQKHRKKDQPAYKCVKRITGKIVECDAVGTGFTLIRRGLFRKIRNKLGIGRWFFDFGLGGLGEDTQFCQRAQKVGARIGVHTGINIGHRGKITFRWNPKERRAQMEAFDQVKDLFGIK